MVQLLHYPLSSAQPCAAVASPWPSGPLAEGRTWHAAQAQEGWGAGRCTVAEQGAARAWPWCEVGVAVAGELVLGFQGRELSLNAGDAFVIPCGAAVQWQARGGFEYAFMAVMAPPEPARAPFKLDLSASLEPCSPPPADVLLGPAPEAWSLPLYEAGALRVGLWQCEAYARRQMRPAYTELMYLLEGGVQLTPEQGAPAHVEAGEVVVAPAGLANAWVSERAVRKVYCIWG
ncbi:MULTISPECIES: cupin domain-containing protein [unclassified Pseudomonas]|uniref:cupin domain-containing protein n=1 Tax=unclassified Pseudomonas TaxID=196821 RepID=UPI000BD59F37|nr:MULTISPECIES: cupin domain-containing protein [unclassified Pseudomonas]PVZ19696.1 putative cupin superfamily protein [Pseudomonas sp. URIL14HWK12:I12]PVZ22719.1 putative cupin superfamily protein [Pseudomonas sp. URIL14HWK12:I10]PVZ37651.1 putative cupin superfamily protein [Pseudomonas sp. URIL14HWK12:I11]SNZ15387.1 Predicted enzyme of the cupin superfamily [Pseudomonas sp. URIL14HWK12:I9]